ncbi:MAG TPA: phospholipase D-like domain-containing protein [Terriglobia bacterium]|nr:phospholipase D-like domain-containing protein [Terriglobia bacterium]
MDHLILAPAARRNAVVEFMRSAQRCLTLSMFRCDDLAVIDEVAAAVKRNAEVRVLITHRARGWKQRLKELGALLESTGATVHRYNGPLMKYHAKYIIADNGRALVSSLNFTRKCFESTCDFLVFSEDPAVVAGLNLVFDNDRGQPASPLPELTDRLIVGPDHARQRLTQLLGEARTSIRIIDHRVIDPKMVSLLLEKQKEGVLVQVVGQGPMGGLISHGRMILVDNRVAAIGSIHLSPPSLDSRREVAIVVRDQENIRELNDFFDSLAADGANLMSLSSEAQVRPDEDEDEDEDEIYSTVGA